VIAVAAFLGSRHNSAMPKVHPHADATYRVVARGDGTHGVEVSVPDAYPTIVSPFATAADAEAWIAKHKQEVTDNLPFRRPFRRGL
jgi:hypothetical protein